MTLTSILASGANNSSKKILLEQEKCGDKIHQSLAVFIFVKIE